MRILFLVLFLNCFTCSVLRASSSADAEVLARKYKEIRGEIINQEEAKRKVLADLFKVTLGMKKINKRRERLMNEKHYVETRIRKTSSALADLKADLDGQRERLRARMRGLYKFNGQSTMRLIFSSQTPSDLDRNLKILKILADKDYFLIRAYEKNLATYSRETKKLERHHKHLALIENELKSHELELVAQQQEKNRIVEGLDKTTLSQLLSLERIREQSSKISMAQSDPSLRISTSFFESKGKLVPPVTGEMLQRFGIMDYPRFRVQMRSKGIFVGAPVGTDVKSVFNGEVVFGDSVHGFGKTVILSHGDHYYTVYGNNSELLVRKGQRIQGGTTIARSGPSWRNTSPGAYFEIRHFSDLIDPEEWLNISLLTNHEKEDVALMESNNHGGERL